MIFRAIWDSHLYDPSMARPETPTTRARWDARRAEVIERAAQVFARRGYDQTSVPELAEALEAATGGIYHYFSGKEGLLIAICDQLMEPLLAEAEELADTDAPATEQLRDLVRRWVANVVDHQDHMLVFQQERHLIDHGSQWREVRDSRKRFERLGEGLPAPAPAASDGPRICWPVPRRKATGRRSTSACSYRRCSGWSTTPPSGTAPAAVSPPRR